MQRLEVSGAVRPIYGSLGVKRIIFIYYIHINYIYIFNIYLLEVSLLFTACQCIGVITVFNNMSWSRLLTQFK